MYNSGEKTYNSYCWDERTDLLGTGATSNVYRARCKVSLMRRYDRIEEEIFRLKNFILLI